MGKVSSCWTAKNEISTTTQPLPPRPLIVVLIRRNSRPWWSLDSSQPQSRLPILLLSSHNTWLMIEGRPPEEIDRKLLGIMAS